jgi:hypothetical protein
MRKLLSGLFKEVRGNFLWALVVAAANMIYPALQKLHHAPMDWGAFVVFAAVSIAFVAALVRVTRRVASASAGPETVAVTPSGPAHEQHSVLIDRQTKVMKPGEYWDVPPSPDGSLSQFHIELLEVKPEENKAQIKVSSIHGPLLQAGANVQKLSDVFWMPKSRFLGMEESVFHFTFYGPDNFSGFEIYIYHLNSSTKEVTLKIDQVSATIYRSAQTLS